MFNTTHAQLQPPLSAQGYSCRLQTLTIVAMLPCFSIAINLSACANCQSPTFWNTAMFLLFFDTLTCPHNCVYHKD